MFKLTKNRIIFLLAASSVFLLALNSAASDFERKVEDETRDYLRTYTSFSEEEIEELTKLYPAEQPPCCPSDAEFKSSVIEAMRDYLTKPAGKSRFTKEEVKDMIIFYLTSQDLSKSDCSSTGAYSGQLMSDIVKKTASCEEMCDLIKESYYTVCDLRYELCTKGGHPSSVCNRLKDICYQVAELEYEWCMLECENITLTTTTTAAETTTSTISNITTSTTIDTTTTIHGGCHTHENPGWLTSDDYEILVIEEGCNDSCGTEYLIEVRRESHPHCGERLWIWLEPGTSPVEVSKCYLVFINVGGDCGHMITDMGDEITCPACCHTHENLTWLTADNYDMKVLEEGCTTPCGTEHLIEIRETSQSHCGESLWVWLDSGSRETGECYTEYIYIGNCGHTIYGASGPGQNITCPECPTTTTTISETTTTTIPETTTTTIQLECRDLGDCHECLGNGCEWCDRQLPWPAGDTSYCMDGSCNVFNCFLGSCITNPVDCPGPPPTTTTTTISDTTTTTSDTTTTISNTTTTTISNTTTTSTTTTSSTTTTAPCQVWVNSKSCTCDEGTETKCDYNINFACSSDYNDTWYNATLVTSFSHSASGQCGHPVNIATSGALLTPGIPYNITMLGYNKSGEVMCRATDTLICEINGSTTTTTTSETTTTVISKLSFSNFVCSQIEGGNKCSLNYENNAGEEIIVLLLFKSAKTGKIVSTGALIVPEGTGTVVSILLCNSVDPGKYNALWRAYKESDSKLTDPLAWSKSTEVKDITCPTK
ncbi:MAG: hypothetical protein KAU03_00885 [Candidatus Altiarchaeales archaeon]|nr:hypothetical protein [Candidatus Altiarchaeales archaeon]